MIGAPGSYYWTGTIKVYNMSSDSFYSPNRDNIDSHRYSYLGEGPLMAMAEQLYAEKDLQLTPSLLLGYAVTAGHFSAPNVIDIAAGAPQHSGSGKVGTPTLVCVFSLVN